MLRDTNNKKKHFVIVGKGGGGGIEQVQSDWAQTDNTQVDYIKNKPTIKSEWFGTQAEFDLIDPKDANTIYYIEDANGSVVHNNKTYGIKVKIEEVQPTPFPEYLTATYIVSAPSNSFTILSTTDNISGWRYKGDTVWQTPTGTIAVTNYGLIDIEFNLTNNTMIARNQFRNCYNLVKIQLPSTITTISESSFFSTGLIELPNLQNVTSIGEDCFYSCVFNYVDYTINDNVDRSGWRLKSMNFSVNSLIYNKLYVNGVLFRALQRWNQGDDVDFRNGIDGLSIYKWYLFGGSYKWNLNSIKFPATLTNITGRAFQGCTITNLYFYGTTPPVCDIYDGQGIWIGSNITNIYVPAEALTAYQNSADFADVVSKIQAMP